MLSSEQRRTCMCIKAQQCDSHTPLPLSLGFSVPQRNSDRSTWIRSEFWCKVMQLFWHLSFVSCHWLAITLLSCLTELPLQPICCRREHLAPSGMTNENLFPCTIINCTAFELQTNRHEFQGKCQWSKVNLYKNLFFPPALICCFWLYCTWCSTAQLCSSCHDDQLWCVHTVDRAILLFSSGQSSWACYHLKSVACSVWVVK